MSLRERRDVVALCRNAPMGGVLYSVVHVAGSSYRRPGARMAALPDGQTAGTLSGGCLEANLLRRGAWMIREKAVVEHVSTSFDDTAEIPYGLGCGGEIDILIEAMQTPEAAALLLALEATLHGEERTVANFLPGDRRANGSQTDTLARIVLDAHGDVLFATETLPTETVVVLRSAARGVSAMGNPCLTIESVAGKMFVERLQPVQRLVIFGAGADARPLTRLAAEMGWSVIVVDSRPQFVKPERFLTADRVLLAESAAGVSVLAGDAVVLMTHSYAQDRRLLAELLPLAPRYLGLLGARHRSALLLQEAADLSGLTLRDATERTHVPIGLELGGDGPEAVALAITAEVQYALFAAKGKPLSRNLTVAQVEQFLVEGPTRSAMREECALFAEMEPLPLAPHAWEMLR